MSTHETQALDLQTHKWSDVRKSYHSLIHRGQEQLTIGEESSLLAFRLLHYEAFGPARSLNTFLIQDDWLGTGHVMVVSAINKHDQHVAAALWIIYHGSAFYGSGPSIERNAQHAVIWESLKRLRARGVRLVELGQIDGETEKEKGISRFKSGCG